VSDDAPGCLDLFESCLETLGQHFSALEDKARAMELPPDALEDLKQEHELGLSGLELWNDSLSLASQFLETENFQQLEDALEGARRAHQLLQEASASNRATVARLESATDPP
jgi:hypothetical protein